MTIQGIINKSNRSMTKRVQYYKHNFQWDIKNLHTITGYKAA